MCKIFKINSSTYSPKSKFRIQYFNRPDDGITAILGTITSPTLISALTALGLFTLERFYVLVQTI